jgi:8-oxo-dGTP diphosphatase
MDPRPRVGVGVFVISKSHPGCVLLGKRRGSAGAGSWALPGGHLEFGEDWALCAEREVFEETGLRLSQVRCTAVLNAVVTEQSYHYLVILMRGEANGEPQNLEPDKCEGWSWCSWAAPLPEPLFTSLAIARARGVSPFVEGASVLETEELPRYCCVILEEESDITGTAWLLEGRPPDAAVAAGQLTCFGGKREPGEEPQTCILRECKEELGWQPLAVSRAVDLYVNGELIAWFYQATAPPRGLPLTLEAGRRAVWVNAADVSPADGLSLSSWHACVLLAHQAGQSRADFSSSAP